jgi:hypothetical protein
MRNPSNPSRARDRDRKPRNAFLAVDDSGEARVELLDFGLAKLETVATPEPGLPAAASAATERPAAGGMPEHDKVSRGARVAGQDATTDVKALGAITPFGGVAFLVGWIWLAVAALRG